MELESNKPMSNKKAVAHDYEADTTDRRPVIQLGNNILLFSEKTCDLKYQTTT